MPSDLTLLCIHRNSLPGLFRLVRTMKEITGDILVVDSSDPAQHEQLKERLGSERVEVRRVLPLGWGDAYRCYGTSRARTGEILQIDSDEYPTAGLVSRIAQGLACEAAIIPRRETGGEFTYHLRWYHKSAVRFDGPSFAYPTISGKVLQVGREGFLDHRVLNADRESSQDRWDRYAQVDALERPMTANGLRYALFPPRRSGLSERRSYALLSGGDILDRPQSEVYLVLEAARTLLRGGSPHLAWDRYRYGRFRIRWTQTLPPEGREWFQRTARAVVESGGLLRYLNLTDPDYLDALTASFPWDLDPGEVLLRLVRARATSGAPARPDIWESTGHRDCEARHRGQPPGP